MKYKLIIPYRKTRKWIVSNNGVDFKYCIVTDDHSLNKKFHSKEEVKIYLNVINKKLGKRIFEKERLEEFDVNPAMVFYLKNK